MRSLARALPEVCAGGILLVVGLIVTIAEPTLGAYLMMTSGVVVILGSVMLERLLARKSTEAQKDARTREPRERLKRSDQVVAILETFLSNGRAEVSLMEVVESAKRLGSVFTPSLDLKEDSTFSTQLMQAMDDAVSDRYISKFQYQADGLPRSFLKLTPIGIGHARRITGGISENARSVLKDATDAAVKVRCETFQMWPRSLL
jgi:hypothetical protein